MSTSHTNADGEEIRISFHNDDSGDEQIVPVAIAPPVPVQKETKKNGEKKQESNKKDVKDTKPTPAPAATPAVPPTSSVAPPSPVKVHIPAETKQETKQIYTEADPSPPANDVDPQHSGHGYFAVRPHSASISNENKEGKKNEEKIELQRITVSYQ